MKNSCNEHDRCQFKQVHYFNLDLLGPASKEVLVNVIGTDMRNQ